MLESQKDWTRKGMEIADAQSGIVGEQFQIYVAIGNRLLAAQQITTESMSPQILIHRRQTGQLLLIGHRQLLILAVVDAA